MSESTNILSELTQIAPALTTISRNNVYSVPLNYFDGLAGNILIYIKDNIAGLNFGSSAVPFTTPANYFKDLPDSILGKIKMGESKKDDSEELKDIAPVLNSISRQMPFAVPSNYFNDLSINISGSTNMQPKSAKIIKGWFSRPYKYAAAAITAAVIVISAVFFSSQPGTINSSAYTSDLNISGAVNKVSEAEINEFLNNNSFISESSIPNGEMNTEVDILNVLEQTSDQEIRDYLKDYERTMSLKPKDS